MVLCMLLFSDSVHIHLYSARTDTENERKRNVRISTKHTYSERRVYKSTIQLN
uniref:CSON003202 protein n=1 Tax=Culicoides sonorensis TaxID=179676 RepID=A0A336MRY6_CULSO